MRTLFVGVYGHDIDCSNTVKIQNLNFTIPLLYRPTYLLIDSDHEHMYHNKYFCRTDSKMFFDSDYKSSDYIPQFSVSIPKCIE